MEYILEWETLLVTVQAADDSRDLATTNVASALEYSS